MKKVMANWDEDDGAPPSCSCSSGGGSPSSGLSRFLCLSTGVALIGSTLFVPQFRAKNAQTLKIFTRVAGTLMIINSGP